MKHIFHYGGSMDIPYECTTAVLDLHSRGMMGISRRWRRLLTEAAALSASLVIGGCGSTTPASPSPVPDPAPQYPSLVGVWTGGGEVVLQYRDTDSSCRMACGSRILSCNSSQMIVREQTGGTFSGLMRVEGGSGDSGRHCSWESLFTAQMAPDGTITSFRPDHDFGGGCAALLSDATVSGTATNTVTQIKLMHHATCMDSFGQPRDTDRTLSIAVGRLHG